VTTGLSTPNPDPTILTTEALLREVSQLEQQVQRRFSSEKELILEKFSSVQTQLALIEDRRVEQKLDTAAAVAAALSAAKEAVNEQKDASDRSSTKTETAFSEQLKQLSQTFVTALNGITVTVDDLKQRLVAMESLKQGGQDRRTDQRSSTALVITVVSTAAVILFGLIAAAVSIIALTGK
jgi:uncharacterized protein YicC (UPF0701 family)